MSRFSFIIVKNWYVNVLKKVQEDEYNRDRRLKGFNSTSPTN